MFKSKKKMLRLFAILLSVGLVGSLFAVGCGRSYHKHGDMKMAKKMIRWHVEDKLDDIDVDDDQRQKIMATLEDVLSNVEQMKAKHKGHEAELLTELRNGPPDPDKMHARLDAKFMEMNGFAHSVLDKAIQAYGVLRPDQQQALLDDLADHMDDH